MDGDEINQLLSAAIANAQPDQLGRMAVNETALLEIRILGDQREAVGAGITQTSSSACPSSPHSRTWALPGNCAAKSRASLGGRFSSNSNFMRHDIQPAVTIGGEGETRLNVLRCQVGGNKLNT